MLRTRLPFTAARTRRGSILLVVITFLALFAVVGLAFALYAESGNNASRIHMEAFKINEKPGRANPDEPNPMEVANLALGQIIYDTVDGGPQQSSDLRGHSLARLMFSGAGNLSAYNGQGLFTAADGLTPENFTDPIFGAATIDRTQVFHYAARPNNPIQFDPELGLSRTATPNPTLGRIYKGINAGYTYPDAKDVMLAVFDTVTPGQVGRVLKPSYALPGQSYNLSSPEYFTPAGRFHMLRTRPLDNLVAYLQGTGKAADFASLQTFLTGAATPAQKNAFIANLCNKYNLFPYPPVNSDGTVTGDVQNFTYPDNHQHNDSFWMFLGGPVRKWNGKHYVPVVAPLIMDLNGRVNLSVAGNVARGPAHASAVGLGPWEINAAYVLANANPSRAIQAQRQLLSGAGFPLPGDPTHQIFGRYGQATPNDVPADRYTNVAQGRYNDNIVPPFYSRVNVRGAAGGRYAPIGTNFSPFPNSSGPQYPADATQFAPALTDHPMQFEPSAFGPKSLAGLPGTLPIPELFVLATKYGGRMDRYGRSLAAQLAPQHLLSERFTYDNGGAPPTVTPFNPLNTTLGPINPVRTTYADHADLVRLLTTPYSSSLHRPELILPAINNMATFDPANLTFARLGPIDLNRPLAEYRTNLASAINPDNVGNWMAAQRARQNFARDIFVRLAAMLPNFVNGVDSIYVNDPSQPDYGYLRFINNPATAVYSGLPKLNVLRALAQVAVNIVDYIDHDDVITTFTFWPVPAAGIATPPGTIFLPDGSGTSTGMPNIGGAGIAIPPAELGNHVVFGTELPKVVLNEAFVELGNDSRDWNPQTQPGGPPLVGMNRPAQHNFEKRVWLELHNNITTATDPNIPEGGRVRLFYPNGAYASLPGVTPVHQVVLVDLPAAPAASPIDNPANVTGSPLHPTASAAGVTVRTLVSQYQYDATYGPQHTAMAAPLEQSTIKPYTNPGNPGTFQTNDNGYYVLGPLEDFPEQSVMMNNDAALGATMRVQDPNPAAPIRNRMQYDAGTRDLTNPQQALAPVGAYLQRTANPYLPPNDPLHPTIPFNPALPINPFITVDRMENLPVNNNIRYDINGEVMPAPMPAMMNSVGRNHPYMARINAAQTRVVGASPKNSFFTHNDVLIQPMPWLKHLDRHLNNPIELAGVSAVPPSELTQLFATPGTPDRWNTNTIESILLPGTSRGVTPSSVPSLTSLFTTIIGPTPVSSHGLGQKLLDFLTVRSFYSGVPIGGREHGKLNVNTIWHQSVMRALFDANDNTLFEDQSTTTAGVVNAGPVPNADLTTSFWARLIGPNPPLANPVPPASPYVFRTPAFPNVSLNDVPIWSVSNAPPSFAGSPPQFTPNTLLRKADPNNPLGPSLFYNDLVPPTVGDPQHFEAVTEPLQKVWNNVTTTSNQFLVMMTISFIEVLPESPGIANVGGALYFGRELFREVPGDLRSKFHAVVDRTALGLDVQNSNLQADEKPWFTRLAADVFPGATTIQIEAAQVAGVVDGAVPTPNPIPHAIVDGVARPIIDPLGSLLPVNKRNFRLGFGDRNLNQADGELIVTDTQTPPTMMNIPRAQVVGWNGSVCTISLPTGVTVQNYHPAGSPVSNVLLGNPGPQPTFDVTNARYRGVIPAYQLVPRGQ